MTTTQISVEEIMHRIREEVRRRKAQMKQKAAPAMTDSPEREFSLEPIRLSFSLPEQRIEIKDSYHVNELLAFHDAEFVKNAYRAILRREPDHEGYEHYLTGLRNGKFSKIEILGRLRYSPEGRQKGVKIKGLLLPFGVKCLKKIPIVGYIAGTLVGIANLNTITRNMENFEAFVNTYFTKQLQREQEVLAVLESEINKTIERINHKIALIGLLENRLSDQKNEIIRQLENELRGQREEIIGQVNESLEEIKGLLFQRVSSEQLENKLRGQREEIIKLLDEKLRDIREEMREKKEIGEFAEMSQEQFLPKAIELSKFPIANISQAKDNEVFYYLFENVFYNADVVKHKQQIYLKYISRKNTYKFLDIGCGRGEFLEILQENNIRAVGVDLNKFEITNLRQRGFEVYNADALEFLKNSNEVFAGISALQVIEHMEFNYLFTFLEECYKKLVNGGVIILETINPHSLIGLANFYVDPTHTKPLPPELLAFLLEWIGFKDLKIIYSAPLPKELRLFADIRRNYHDYGIIGYKP